MEDSAPVLEQERDVRTAAHDNAVDEFRRHVVDLASRGFTDHAHTPETTERSIRLLKRLLEQVRTGASDDKRVQVMETLVERVVPVGLQHSLLSQVITSAADNAKLGVRKICDSERRAYGVSRVPSAFLLDSALTLLAKQYEREAVPSAFERIWSREFDTRFNVDVTEGFDANHDMHARSMSDDLWEASVELRRIMSGICAASVFVTAARLARVVGQMTTGHSLVGTHGDGPVRATPSWLLEAQRLARGSEKYLTIIRDYIESAESSTVAADVLSEVLDRGEFGDDPRTLSWLETLQNMLRRYNGISVADYTSVEDATARLHSLFLFVESQAFSDEAVALSACVAVIESTLNDRFVELHRIDEGKVPTDDPSLADEGAREYMRISLLITAMRSHEISRLFLLSANTESVLDKEVSHHIQWHREHHPQVAEMLNDMYLANACTARGRELVTFRRKLLALFPIDGLNDSELGAVREVWRRKAAESGREVSVSADISELLGERERELRERLERYHTERFERQGFLDEERDELGGIFFNTESAESARRMFELGTHRGADFALQERREKMASAETELGKREMRTLEHESEQEAFVEELSGVAGISTGARRYTPYFTPHDRAIIEDLASAVALLHSPSPDRDFPDPSDLAPAVLRMINYQRPSAFLSRMYDHYRDTTYEEALRAPNDALYERIAAQHSLASLVDPKSARAATRQDFNRFCKIEDRFLYLLEIISAGGSVDDADAIDRLQHAGVSLDPHVRDAGCTDADSERTRVRKLMQEVAEYVNRYGDIITTTDATSRRKLGVILHDADRHNVLNLVNAVLYPRDGVAGDPEETDTRVAHLVHEAVRGGVREDTPAVDDVPDHVRRAAVSRSMFSRWTMLDAMVHGVGVFGGHPMHTHIPHIAAAAGSPDHFEEFVERMSALTHRQLNRLRAVIRSERHSFRRAMPVGARGQAPVGEVFDLAAVAQIDPLAVALLQACDEREREQIRMHDTHPDAVPTDSHRMHAVTSEGTGRLQSILLGARGDFNRVAALLCAQ